MPLRNERGRRYGEDLTEKIDDAAVGSAKTPWRRFSKGERTMSSWVDASSPCDAIGGNVEVNCGLSGKIEELDRGPAMAAAALGRAWQWRCRHGSTTRSSGAVW
jgi:hypothetical protein